jgi:hypothetical protein
VEFLVKRKGFGKEICLEVETVGLDSEGRDGVGRCLVERKEIASRSPDVPSSTLYHLTLLPKSCRMRHHLRASAS